MFWNKRIKEKQEELEDRVAKLERILEHSKEGEITGETKRFVVVKNDMPLLSDCEYKTYFYKSNQEYVIDGLKLYKDSIVEADDSDDMILHVVTENKEDEPHSYIVDLKTCKYIEMK